MFILSLTYQRYQWQYAGHKALAAVKATYYCNLCALIAVFHTEAVLQHPQAVHAVIFLHILQQALGQRVVVEAERFHGSVWHYLYGNIAESWMHGKI